PVAGLEALAEALDVARRHFDLGIAAAVGGTLRAGVAHAHGNREGLAVFHSWDRSSGSGEFYASDVTTRTALCCSRNRDALNPFRMRIRFIAAGLAIGAGLAQKKGKKVNARTVIALLALLCAAEVRAHGGLVDLSVYDRTEGRRLAVHWHEGRAYVVGKPGYEYQVS